ncbi:MAG: FAD-dependent oxidoreductase, partial [Candidatus Cloacimonetes bacterium]|nr:FAD-dependent oxidoreductase [Candidatus Cloacimonadota bacterium]
MSDIKIKLNGKITLAKENQTIFDIAEENGIEIPTLCYEKYLKPLGSCQLCLVEIKNEKDLALACATQVQKGMQIETDNEKVYSARKIALEKLLSDHYADCIAPCTLKCPVQVDIQGAIALIHNGLYHEAVKLIKEKLPLPLSVSRICPAFCEQECRRQLVDESIAIRQINRFAADKDLENAISRYIPEKKPGTGKEVVIIGAGPAGLTVAYFLTLEGHHCTIYDANPESGGMLRYAIPEFRLPKDILDKEIEQIEKLGVRIRNNVKLGHDFTLQFLEKEFDAIFLALGAQDELKMNIEGENLDGCFLGTEFLRQVIEKKIKKVGNIVAVIGGENTAVEIARTSLHLGAEKVMIIYSRTEELLLAEKNLIESAKEEGIEFHFLQRPTKILGKDKKIVGMQCVKMRLGEPDKDGPYHPVPLPNSEFIMKVDTVISAIGRVSDTKFLLNETSKINSKHLLLTKQGKLVVDEKTKQTNIDKIFAGGELTRGSSTAIEAVADGYIAAKSIHEFLSGKEISKLKQEFIIRKAKSVLELDSKEFEKYEKIPRIDSQIVEIKTRIKNFEEIEKTLSEEDIQKESERCLECGCSANQICKLRKYATDFGIDSTKFIGGEYHPIDESHPFILRDPNKCIKCGICVQTCFEIQGVGALGDIHQDFGAPVSPDFGKSLLETSCESCGKCIDICPVGALTSRNTQLKIAPISLSEIVTTCGLCGCGCQINYKSSGNLIVQAEAKESPITDNNVCFDARFGYEVLQSNARLKTPLIRKEHTLQKSTWEEVFQLISEKLPDLAPYCAIFANGNFTNEELFLINQIAKKFNIQKKFSWELNGSVIQDKLGINYSPNTTSDLLETDLIVLVGDVSHTLGIKILEAIRKGKKLLILNSEKNKFSKIANTQIQSKNYIEIFNQFAKYLIENRCHNIDSIVKSVENFAEYNHKLQTTIHKDEFYEFADILVKNRKVIFVYSESELGYHTQLAILNLSILKGNLGEQGSGIITCSELANKPTLQSYGFTTPKFLNNINSALIFGEDPLFDNKLDTYNWLNGLDFLL